jgi:hypothetical protein
VYIMNNTVENKQNTCDIAVDIATGYELDVAGISIPGRGNRLLKSAVSRPALAPT